MKKNLVLLFFLSIFFVSACGSSKDSLSSDIPEEGNQLMENANPTGSALSLYKYDGKKVTYYTMYNDSKEQEILDKIQNVDSVEIEDWTLNQIKYPVYGLDIGGKDGFTVFGAWSNGHWIAQDGKVYQFAFDFKSLESDYDWDSVEKFDSANIFPCIRYLCQRENDWNKKMMEPAEKLENTDGVSMKIIEKKDNIISVEVKNESEMPWEYGEIYSLQVKINGKWYVVPPIPGNWGFTLPLYRLTAGESFEKSYNIQKYGELPSGTYRIVVENLAAEFEVK